MLFSIIIPTYNRAGFIEKTISSFINQSYGNFELIIVDDGSSDNTEELVKKIDDKRIQYFKQEKKGVSAARNFGISKSSGDYLNFFDSDDLAYTNHLQTAFDFFTKKTDAEILLVDFEWGDEKRKKVQQIRMRCKDPNHAILKSNYPAVNSFFIKRNILNDLKFNEKLSIAEDWDLWLKLSVRYKFHLAKVVTSYIVDHPARTVRNFNLHNFLKQKNNLLQSLKSDTAFFKNREKYLPMINSHMTSYVSVHALLDKQKMLGFKLFKKSVLMYPSSIFSIRSMAIIKNLIFSGIRK